MCYLGTKAPSRHIHFGHLFLEYLVVFYTAAAPLEYTVYFVNKDILKLENVSYSALFLFLLLLFDQLLLHLKL
jgi:hypothetical protein